MKQLLLLITLCLPIYIWGQIEGIVIDDKKKSPIPFVNIYIEGKNVGTSSNEDGTFVFNTLDSNQIIILSAIGYKTKRIQSDTFSKEIQLSSQATELQEIIITSKKQNQEITIDAFKKSKINHFFGCGTSPWVVAKYFGYQEDYSQTHYLNKIRLLTKSEVKDSKFNIRLYTINEKGEPANNLYHQNIIGIAKKGKKITEVDLSQLNIKFPEKGFFIAIEWLFIESNKYEYTYTVKNSNNKQNGISHEPKLGTIPSDSKDNSWTLIAGKWNKVSRNNGSLKRYQNKYNQLAIELTLTN